MRTHLLLAVTFAAASTLHAQASPPERTALVELFTSEGCSSCPPADALLRELHGTRTPDGIRILALSEHVTYWNSLGWQDPFSAEAFTARQNRYGDRFALDSVYTPQIVVNGRRQVLGSDRAAVLRAVRETTAAVPAATLHLTTAERSAAGVTIAFTAEPGAGSNGQAAPLLLAAVTDDTDTTSVPRGENEGRTLQHVSVLRELREVGRGWSTTARSATVPLPAGPARPRHLVLFAEDPATGHILGVVTARSVDAKPCLLVNS